MTDRDTSVRSTLAAIDAAIAAAGTARCAWCDEPIPDGAPSRDFHVPVYGADGREIRNCQRSWHEQFADRPQEVLERKDAAVVYEDSAVWLGENRQPVTPARSYHNVGLVRSIDMTPADLDFLAEAARQWTTAVVEIAHTLGRTLRAIQPQLQKLQRAGVIPTPPPADPRQRALDHVRNRNTGPQRRPRAPRRIDPPAR